MHRIYLFRHFYTSRYMAYVLFAFVTEETLDIAHHAANTLVEFGVDLIVDYLVDLSINHLIDHLATRDGHMGLNRVQPLIDEVVSSRVNCSIHSEVADVLEDI